MKQAFRALAQVVAVAAVLAWFALGANRGWTRTSVPVRTLDEATGIEGIEYRKQFVPGLELLAVALAGAGLLGAASFLFRKPQTNPQH
jgi:hypothetical protein